MNPEQLKNIIEAALMASEKPVSVNQLLALFEKEADKPEKADVKAAIEQITQDYNNRGIELKEVSSGYRVQVNGKYANWVNHLFDDRPPRYSKALLETLAIIAYRQPVTRAEIEEIRGVSVSSNIIRMLQERSWICVVGQRDIPGRPELLATTKEFLDYFNLKKLSELPSLSEIKDFDKINPDLFEELEMQANNEVAKATMPAQQINSDKQTVMRDDKTFSVVETEKNSINDEDNVIPFG